MGRRAILIGPLALKDRKLGPVLARLKPRGGRDFLVGVDAGVQCFPRLGLKPSLAVGDWDSIRDRKLLREFPHVTLNPDKSRSDFFYALEAALTAGVDEILCLGLTGGRPDHHWGVISDLATAVDESGSKLRSVTAIGPEGEYHVLARSIPTWKASLPAGRIVSVFSLGDATRGVTIRGMRYPLEKATLRPSSHGLSNVASGGKCSVSLRSGRLLVIIPFENAYGVL